MHPQMLQVPFVRAGRYQAGAGEQEQDSFRGLNSELIS